jgi:hypothetical protein
VSPHTIALFVAVTILGGAVGGALLRARLPGHHLDSDTKDIVKSGVGLLSTLAALVLGLVIAAAKNSFDTQANEVQDAAAKLVQLDDVLRQLGPDGDAPRRQLAQLAARRVDDIWMASDGTGGFQALAEHRPSVLATYHDALHRLAAANPAQRSLLDKAAQLSDELLRIRSLAIAHTGSAIMAPLLSLLVFWFAVIAAGLNLFAPRNGTIWAVNVIVALSVAGAIFLILEMDQPFGGMIAISDAPMRAALAQMAR